MYLYPHLTHGGFFMEITNLYQHIKGLSGVSTDTRTLSPGMAFFALKGDNYDANDFIDQALQAGAALVVTQNPAFQSHKNCFFTDDTLGTLQAVALEHRKNLKATIIGITGTNGKTTTKELLREALSSIGKVQATSGNLNNHIGVPLTLLSINDDTDFAIVEMGANHPGEIEFLCNIARPDYGLVTNIGKAHLEGFGSFEGVIKTKSELYQYIAASGKAVFVNENDPLLRSLTENQPRHLYGTNSLHATVIADENPQLRCAWSWQGEPILTQTQLTGSYNLPNLLAAIGVGLFFGANASQINEKLCAYRPSNMRSQWIETPHNKMILDAYNANPSSMKTAIENFATLQADKKMLILGDMLELGSYSDDEHLKILSLVESFAFNSVVLIGPCFAKFQNQFHPFLFFTDTSEARKALEKNKANGFTILLKGSRGIGVDKLKDLF